MKPNDVRNAPIRLDHTDELLGSITAWPRDDLLGVRGAPHLVADTSDFDPDELVLALEEVLDGYEPERPLHELYV